MNKIKKIRSFQAAEIILAKSLFIVKSGILYSSFDLYRMGFFILGI